MFARPARHREDERTKEDAGKTSSLKLKGGRNWNSPAKVERLRGMFPKAKSIASSRVLAWRREPGLFPPPPSPPRRRARRRKRSSALGTDKFVNVYAEITRRLAELAARSAVANPMTSGLLCRRSATVKFPR